MSEESIEDYPPKFREVHLSNLNNSVVLRSTFEKENMDYLVQKAINIMNHLEKKNNGE